MTKKELVVGFESALDYWRAARVAGAKPEEEPTNGKVIGALPLTLSQRASRAIEACCTSAPLQVIVRDAAQRRNCPLIEDRVFKGPLGGSRLLKIGDEVSVCKIEPVYVQLATKASRLELATVASEMCGRYGVVAQGADSLETDLEPIATVSDLRAYAQSCRALGVRGASSAVKALELAVDGAASPREAEIAAFFLESRRLGGAEVGGFEMNKRLMLPAELQKMMGCKVLIPDFIWVDQGLIVEYDSNLFHLNPAQRLRDEKRRRAFERMGYRVLSLSNEILINDAQLNIFVSDMERSLGMKRKPLTSGELVKRQALREALFGAERPFV